jgi:hypothetical protein
MRFIKKLNSGEDLFLIYTIAIACCSSAIAFLFFYQDAFFDKVGWIDPFLYVGYGANYFDDSYSANYKISRLPWVLVQTFFRSIFAKEIVGYLLHFSLYALGSFLIFRIARKFAPPFVCALLALPFPLFLLSYSGQADYHNNFAAVLFLYLIFYVASHAKNDKDNKKFFIKTGFLYALTIHTSTLLSLDSALFAAAFYIGIKLQNQKNPFEKIGKKFLWVFSGLLLCTLILCLINESFGRHFWFMKPLWKFMLGSSTGNNADYWQPIVSFIGNTKHLSFFAAVFFYSLFVSAKILLKNSHQKHSLILAVNIAYILVICELLTTQILQINNLQIDYFAFNALVPSFLTLAINSSYFFLRKNVNINSKKTLVSTLFFAILLTIFLLKNHIFSNQSSNQFFIYFALWLALFVFAHLTKKLPFSHFVTAILFLLLTAANYENKIQFQISRCPHSKSITQAYLEFDEHVKKYKSNFHNRSFSNIFVWWNSEKPEIKCFDAYSSYSNIDFAQSLVSGGAASSYPIDNPLIDGSSQAIERLWSTDRSTEFKDKFFDYTQENRVVILFSKNHEDVAKMIKKLQQNGLKFSLTEQRKIITDAFVLDYFILSEEKESHVSRQASL